MKNSQLEFLFSTIFLAGSFLAHSIIASFYMMLLGIMLAVIGAFTWRMESQIEFLENMQDSLKFKLIVGLLDNIQKKHDKKQKR